MLRSHDCHPLFRNNSDDDITCRCSSMTDFAFEVFRPDSSAMTITRLANVEHSSLEVGGVSDNILSILFI